MATNIKATYSDTSTNIRNVVPVFDLLSPRELPLLKLFSGGDENNPSLNSLSEPCMATKYEWMEDTDPSWTVTFGANSNFANTSTAEITGITLSSGHGARIRVGQILEIRDTSAVAHQALVTAVSSDTIAIKRGWGVGTDGTFGTPTSVATITTGTIVGRAHEEGTAAPDDRMYYPSMVYNYVQEFAEAVTLTNQEQNIRRYGIDRALDYETDKVTRKLLKNMERQALFGKRVIASSGVPGAFGGLPQYINSTIGNITDINAALSRLLINQRLEATFNLVGAAAMPDTILVSATGKRYLTTLYGTSGVTSFRNTNDPVGGDVIDMLKTDVGDMRIELVNDMLDTQIYFVRKDKIGIGPLNGMGLKREMMAKTGTADTWMVYGAYTFQVRQSLSHCALLRVQAPA